MPSKIIYANVGATTMVSTFCTGARARFVCSAIGLDLLHHEPNVLSRHVEFRAERIPHLPSVEM
jgi:hypothetical protein